MNRNPNKASDDAHLLIGQALGQTYRRLNRTENYVEIPPAFAHHDSDGAVWTIGFTLNPHCHNIFAPEYNVLRNDIDVGQFAARIVIDRGVVTLYGQDGRRQFSRNRKFFL
jgi:hypothetical protein